MASKIPPPNKSPWIMILTKSKETGKEMVREKMYYKIQAYKQMGYTIRGCAREIDFDRKTIRKYWEMTAAEYLAYLSSSSVRTKLLNAYREEIVLKLESYPNITSAIIFDRLKEAHEDFKPSYRSVRLYVSRLREELGIPTQVAIRQYLEVAELPPGKQAQIDMGQMNMTNPFGKKIKLYIFAMVLAHSRKKFVYFQDHPFNAEDFIMAHDLAFKYYSGRPKEIVYDQDRVMVVSENNGDIIFTEAFEAYRRYVGFDVHLCRGFDPQSKGKIENVVKYVKRNYLACRIYHGIAELNSGGIAWLDRTANTKIHESTKLIPDKVFLSERKHLLFAPSIKRPPEARSAIVRKTNVVHFKQNRYEVPKGTYFPGRTARIDADHLAGIVMLSDEKTGEILAKHNLALGTGRLIKLDGGQKTYPPERYKKVKDELMGLIGKIDGSAEFVDCIIKTYPRYAKDQLSLLIKCAKNYNSKDISAALDYCIKKELTSANDFRDTLAYLASLHSSAPQKTVVIPNKYHSFTPKVRSLAVYQKAVGR
jgi:transposase